MNFFHGAVLASLASAAWTFVCTMSAYMTTIGTVHADSWVPAVIGAVFSVLVTSLCLLERTYRRWSILIPYAFAVVPVALLILQLVRQRG